MANFHDAGDSRELPKPENVQSSVRPRRAETSGASSSEALNEESHPARHPGGRPHARWRIRVVRIDGSKYPQFQKDRDHPFGSVAAKARIEDIDAFLARLRTRRKIGESNDGGLAAAA